MANKAMTVQELRELLASDGYPQEELVNMSKKELKEAWERSQNAKKLLDNVEVPKSNDSLPIDLSDSVAEPSEPRPLPTDPEWTEYVLEQFTDKELDNGSPKVDALRRVAEKLLGPFDSFTDVIQTPDMDHGATVKVSIRFHGDNRNVDGAADVSTINTARDYAVHAVATAETRAEGRALRKALRLTKVLAAEELQNADTDEANGSDGRAPAGMINGLKVVCERQKIDLDRFVMSEYQLPSPGDMTKEQARGLMATLSAFRLGQKEVPDEIKSF